MSWADILLIAIIAAAAVLAIIRIRKSGGSCSGDCAGCKQSCTKRDKNNGDKV